jgi:ABC-2 type transport system permease protein
VSRSVIILAKVFSASVRAIFQAAIVATVAFALGLVVGTNFGLFSLLGVFAMVFLLSVGLSSLFTALTLRTTRMETPQAIIQLITLPLMFASSAYFPITQMPEWLQVIASINPISYAIDGIRRLMIFSDGFAPLPFDFLYVGMFAVIVTAICVVLSWRYLNK